MTDARIVTGTLSISGGGAISGSAGCADGEVAGGGGANITDANTTNVSWTASYPTFADALWGWQVSGRGTRASAATIGSVYVVCWTTA